MAQLLTVDELMERWQSSRSTILRRARNGKIPNFKASQRKIFFPIDEILSYEESHHRKEDKKKQFKRKVLSVNTNKKWKVSL